MNQDKTIREIMDKCQTDEGFRQRLLSDTNATLAAEGIAIPAGIKVNVLENTSTVTHYILPPAPQAELSDTDLAQVAGGRKNYMDADGHWHGIFG
ncbi:NHLP leader peptide family RiPP precursor [Rhodoferax sp.]|uniref:NHLP leader peptide family RiPP precursor n=1 Tax=Rhodoferax sp. TaxID=50421 RepID=UPI002638CA41|nr:NHLP leader peptide family RiPP precursor [Rhodoferax sp.]MDD2923579.1 NHLP leader peptide family RiPP precursor [Rhodoferax sp.]